MNRRDFLKGMIAAAAAPAIVKADNIMKIWVPPEERIISGQIIVDASRESEPLLSRYKTIAEGVSVAKSGDTVLVMPGQYSLGYPDEVVRVNYGLLDKPITLKAKYPVVIDNYQIEADESRISRLYLDYKNQGLRFTPGSSVVGFSVISTIPDEFRWDGVPL